MKRGPDLDIEAIFTDLESDRPSFADDSDDIESPGAESRNQDSPYDDDEDDDTYR